MKLKTPTQLPKYVLFSIFTEVGQENVVFTAYSLVEHMPFLPRTSH